MALIGTIRKNSWLLILVIGLALAAFILMDMTSSSRLGGGSGNSFPVGKLMVKQLNGMIFSQQSN